MNGVKCSSSPFEGLRFASKRMAVLALSASILSAASCSTPDATPAGTRANASRKEFTANVKPLLESRCSWCHSNDLARSGLNFQDRDATLNSARRFIVPGSAEASLVYQAVTRADAHPRVMPGDGWGISAARKRALKTWIDTGAYWPEGRKGAIHRKTYRIDRDDYL